MIVQEITKDVVFEFHGLPIVMLSDKTIWHTVRRVEIRQRLNTRSLGYWVDRRFYSLSKLNKLSIRARKKITVSVVIDCPF